MNTPLLSVIIPTYGRPHFLPIAVTSALQSSPDSVEVIVVPNGPDDSWKQSLIPFAKDSRVQIKPIAIAHGNAARNYGMTLARGKYLRFLDDDDYLLPAAAEQLAYIDQVKAEFCSGLLRNVDQHGINHGLISFPNTLDFVCAAANVSGFTLPTGNVFLKSCLSGCHWDPLVNQAQDYAWMMELAAKREWHWIHFNKTVGVWFQHDTQRVSSAEAFRSRRTTITQKIIGLHKKLIEESRINKKRADAIATALWDYAHRGFPYHPIYWSHIAREAQKISKDSGPAVSLFTTGILRNIDPVMSEWMLLPVRRITRLYRDTAASIRGPDYRRPL